MTFEGRTRPSRASRDYAELPLRHPELFEKVGVRPGRGILLWGPPGNGKTLLARAVAGESNAHIETINGPELLSKWVGETERQLREVFERASRLAPSVILMDELDAIAAGRDSRAGSSQGEVVLSASRIAGWDSRSWKGPGPRNDQPPRTDRSGAPQARAPRPEGLRRSAGRPRAPRDPRKTPRESTPRRRRQPARAGTGNARSLGSRNRAPRERGWAPRRQGGDRQSVSRRGHKSTTRTPASVGRRGQGERDHC